MQQNALLSSIALSCALQICMISWQDQALDSFKASTCSSLHTLKDASLLAYTRLPTEKTQLCAKASCIWARHWAWLDGIARGRARARRQLSHHVECLQGGGRSGRPKSIMY